MMMHKRHTEINALIGELIYSLKQKPGFLKPGFLQLLSGLSKVPTADNTNIQIKNLPNSFTPNIRGPFYFFFISKQYFSFYQNTKKIKWPQRAKRDHVPLSCTVNHSRLYISLHYILIHMFLNAQLLVVRIYIPRQVLNLAILFLYC